MPRWLVASILAIVLSCCGLAALAQNLANASLNLHGGNSQMQVCDGHPDPVSEGTSPTDKAQAVDLCDACDDSPSHDEAGSDHVAAVDGGHRASGPFAHSEAPRGLALTPSLSPFLERPKRPPRGTAFSA